MSDNTDLLSIIQEQHKVNLETATALGSIQKTLEDNSARLFGAPGQQGAIPFLHAEVEETKGKVEKLTVWKKGLYKWVAGALAVLTLEGTILIFGFEHLAAIDSLVRSVHK
jgi:hypothetical protein